MQGPKTNEQQLRIPASKADETHPRQQEGANRTAARQRTSSEEDLEHRPPEVASSGAPVPAFLGPGGFLGGNGRLASARAGEPWACRDQSRFFSAAGR